MMSLPVFAALMFIGLTYAIVYSLIVAFALATFILIVSLIVEAIKKRFGGGHYE